MNDIITNIIYAGIYAISIYYIYSTPSKTNIDTLEDKTCSLCLADFKENTARIIPNCNHILHLECYTKLVKSNCPTNKECPTCRKVFITKNEANNEPPDTSRTATRGYSVHVPTPSPSVIISRHRPRQRIYPTPAPHPTPHPTPHPALHLALHPEPEPAPHPTPHPTPHPARRSRRLATIYPGEENNNEIIPSANVLRRWNLYNPTQKNQIINALFHETNLENLLQIKHQNDGTIIASRYNLERWNLHTRTEKATMIRQLFPPTIDV